MVHCAYVCYLANNRDVKGVLLHNYLLNKYNSKYPLVCICTEEVTELNRLSLDNIIIKQFNIKEIAREFKIDDDVISYMYDKKYFGKFSIFLLDMYDKIVYLDADMLLLDNIDELLDLDTTDNIWMVYDEHLVQYTTKLSSENHTYLSIKKNMFNSGIIVCSPKVDFFKLIFKFITRYDIHTIQRIHTDQEIFNILNYTDQIKILPLDHKYNLPIDSIQLKINNKIIDKCQLKIIHYILNNKPWMDNYNKCPFNATSQQYYMEWLSKYNEYLDKSLTRNQSLGNINTESLKEIKYESIKPDYFTNILITTKII